MKIEIDRRSSLILELLSDDSDLRVEAIVSSAILHFAKYRADIMGRYKGENLRKLIRGPADE